MGELFELVKKLFLQLYTLIALIDNVNIVVMKTI